MHHDEPMAMPHGDEGAILLIVLFVTTVLAILIGVVLTNVEVNLRNSTVTKNLDDKTYAADGGVEYAIQRLRQDANACSNLGPWKQNNIDVTVTCTPGPGTSAFGAGWAVITRKAGVGVKSLSTAPGATATVEGPTYVAGGIDLASDLTVTNGQLFQNASAPCSGTPVPTGSGALVGIIGCTATLVDGGAPALPCLVSCAPGAQYSFANPSHGSAPDYIVDSAGAPGAPCGIFLPGKYVAPPDLTAYTHYYFASGVYYFDNVGPIDVGGKELFGGKRGASEMALVDDAPACASDHDAGVSDGDGVEWILGGTSAISVTSPPSVDTLFELFARQPGTSAVEGAAGISIRSVPTPTPGYAVSATNIFSIAGGPDSEVAVHGLVFAPDADISVAGTDAIGAELSGGVVASTLSLDARSDVNPNPLVSTPHQSTVPPPTISHQFFTITSAARGDGPSTITTTAVIELSNDADRSVLIDSWVTNAA